MEAKIVFIWLVVGFVYLISIVVVKKEIQENKGGDWIGRFLMTYLPIINTLYAFAILNSGTEPEE